MRTFPNAKRSNGYPAPNAFNEVSTAPDLDHVIDEWMLTNYILACTCDVWAGHQQKRLTFTNDAWVHFTGHPVHTLLNAGWVALAHPDESQEITERFKMNLETGKLFTMQFRLERRNGEYVAVELTGQPYGMQQGMVEGYTGFVMEQPIKK